MGKTEIDLNHKTVLVTGSPGFIGAALVIRLLKEMKGGKVISFDNMNDYYDPALKKYRLKQIEQTAERSKASHVFVKGDISERKCVESLFDQYHPDVVVHLAAQAGVRYSISHPDIYINTNINGFFHMLEAVRNHPVSHFVYASSSSVYGGNTKVPFSTDDPTDQPVSLYAATKKADELLAYSYAELYGIPSTGLRFFTVYGPAGRPDMFYYSAAQKLAAGRVIQIYNHGECRRDFTYIDDIVEGLYRVIRKAPAKQKDEAGSLQAPHCVYNIGGGTPENILDFISVLQTELVENGILDKNYDFDSHRELVGMQAGDVPLTYADSAAFEKDFDFRPSIPIKEGLKQFVQWYKEYHCQA